MPSLFHLTVKICLTCKAYLRGAKQVNAHQPDGDLCKRHKKKNMMRLTRLETNVGGFYMQSGKSYV